MKNQTFIETIDQVINPLFGGDPSIVASLKAAAIFGAVEAVRRMSKSAKSAAELRAELRVLEETDPSSGIHLVTSKRK